MKFVPKGPINNIPTFIKIMAWRRPGDKPLFKPMMASLPTHICVARDSEKGPVWSFCEINFNTSIIIYLMLQ